MHSKLVNNAGNSFYLYSYFTNFVIVLISFDMFWYDLLPWRGPLGCFIPGEDNLAVLGVSSGIFIIDAVESGPICRFALPLDNSEARDFSCDHFSTDDLRAYAWQPGAGRRGLCWPCVRLSWAYLGPMLAYVSRMWPQVGPMLALCWPKLALCWPKLAQSCPYVGLPWCYVRRR